MEDRYYVQRLTEQIYLVRERLSVDEGPGPTTTLSARLIYGMMHTHMPIVSILYKENSMNKMATGHSTLTRSKKER